jgi:chemotaxis protein histidine kinase CheA
MNTEISKHVELFCNESKSILIEIKKLSEFLVINRENKDLATDIFIKLHDLKGYAKGMGFKAIESMTCSLHDVFRKVSDDELILNSNILGDLKIGISILEQLIKALESGEKVKYLIGKARLGEILGDF